MIRRAGLEDLKDLVELDSSVEEEAMRLKIEAGHVLVSIEETKIVGWLRYGLFGDSIPFMNFITIDPMLRNQGLGKELMNYWETEMMALGHIIVMTAANNDEEAQHFYRKFDYVDSGTFFIPGESLFIMFVKSLIR